MIPPQLATNVSLEIEGTQGLKYEVGSPREMEDNIPAITFVRDEAGKVDQIEMMDRKARRVK
jgi:hypothetical protein